MKNMRQLINAVMVTEGTWALPTTDDQVAKMNMLMQNPIALGDGGENATNQISFAFGDDTLYDNLGDAGDQDPTADARPIIMKWLDGVVGTFGVEYDKYMSAIADANRMGQMELPLDEDSVDDDKTDQLNNLFMSVDALKQEVEELARLDTQEGASGVGDLHDQITTMYNLLDKFDDVIDRSTNIVPLRQGKY
ncbi:hypothetical protein N9V27_01755 [bacterium]|nr:hypothetical protein [bacterium]